MKKSRSSQEQVIGVLMQHRAGIPTAELRRKRGISEATFYNWRHRYGGMEASGAPLLDLPARLGHANRRYRGPDRPRTGS